MPKKLDTPPTFEEVTNSVAIVPTGPVSRIARKRRYNIELAKDGRWFEIYDEKIDLSFGEFKCGLFEAGSPRMRAAAERLANDNSVVRSGQSKPVESLSEWEKRRAGEVELVKMFCETVLVDWRGQLDDEGNEVPFSTEEAMLFFNVDDPDAMFILSRLIEASSDIANFRPDTQKEDPAKN